MEALVEPRIHLWSRDEYYKLAEDGFFHGRRVELVEGQVIDMSPMGSLHATAVALVGRTLEREFGAGYFARWQMPVDAGESSEPEPDIAIIQGHVRDFTDSHPKTAVLIVEVADSSLNYDRAEKAGLYAKVGIADYWILNLVDRQLEVCRDPERDPEADASQPHAFHYRNVTVHKPGESIVTLAADGLIISVDDLLP